jgi:hypothetical protein
MQTLAISSLLVASALAALPNLKACETLTGQAQASCVQSAADAQIADDELRIKNDASNAVAKQQAAALLFVKQKAAGLQAGLDSGKKKRGGGVDPAAAAAAAAAAKLANTKAWCEGEFNIAAFAKLVGVAECTRLCAQFQNPAVADPSSSNRAFECLIPLTADAVDKAADAAARDAAIEAKRQASLLFISTQFQDKDSTLLVADNSNGVGNGRLVKDFAPELKDVAFNAATIADANLGKERAADLAAARAIVASAATPEPARQVTLLFIQKLEVLPEFAGQAVTDKAAPAAGDFAQVADQVFKAADANAVLLALPQEVRFTDLGSVDDAVVNDADFAKFVGTNNGLVLNGQKRAVKAKEIGVFAEDINENLANSLALASFCELKGLKCKSSKAGAISKEEFVEAKVETIKEKEVRLAAEAAEAAKTATTKKAATKAATKAVVNNAYTTKHHVAARPEDDAATASTVFVAVGALLSAVAMLL